MFEHNMLYGIVYKGLHDPLIKDNLLSEIFFNDLDI
jgi:hypothetical protein